MTIYNQNKDEKMQYDIHREAATISVLSLSKIEKNEYLTGEEIFLLIKNKEKSKLNLLILHWGKAFEIQLKTIEDQGQEQIKAIQN